MNLFARAIVREGFAASVNLAVAGWGSAAQCSESPNLSTILASLSRYFHSKRWLRQRAAYGTFT